MSSFILTEKLKNQWKIYNNFPRNHAKMRVFFSAVSWLNYSSFNSKREDDAYNSIRVECGAVYV